MQTEKLKINMNGSEMKSEMKSNQGSMKIIDNMDNMNNMNGSNKSINSANMNSPSLGGGPNNRSKFSSDIQGQSPYKNPSLSNFGNKDKPKARFQSEFVGTATNSEYGKKRKLYYSLNF